MQTRVSCGHHSRLGEPGSGHGFRGRVQPTLPAARLRRALEIERHEEGPVGLLVSPQLAQHETQVDLRVDVEGVDANRLVIGLNGILAASGSLGRESPVVVQRKLGIQDWCLSSFVASRACDPHSRSFAAHSSKQNAPSLGGAL